MRLQVNMVKNKSEVIPAAFLDHVRKQCDTALGMAMLKTGQNFLVLHRSKRGAVSPTDKIEQMMKGFKSANMILALQKLGDGYLDDDVQPFSLLVDQNNNPIIAAFIEGDFSPASKAGTTHTDEFFVANYLTQKLTKMFTQCGNDLVKLEKELDDPLYKMEILSHAVGRGSVTLMFGTGAIKTFEKNDHGKDFPWGWTSNHLNFGDGEAVKPKADDNPFDILEDNTSGSSSGYTPINTEAQNDKGQTMGDVNAKAEKEGEYPERPVIENQITDDEYETVEEAPPSNIKGKNAIKKWYSDRGFSNFNVQSGGINWQERPKISVRKRKPKTDTAVGSVPSVQQAKSEPIKDFKDMGKSMAKHADEDNNLKRVPAEDLKRGIELTKEASVLKYVDKSSNVIEDPKKLLASNSRFVAFWEQAKITKEDFLQYPFEVLVRFAKEGGPELAALVADSYRIIAIQNMMQKPTPSSKGKVDATKPADTTAAGSAEYDFVDAA